jgi:hypothetical protein
MHRYESLSDDFYCNLHLQTELDLPQQRDTVLHFFEIAQRRYPTMSRLYTRERNEIVLEEDKEAGGFRWIALEPKRVCSGTVNPPRIEDALEQHALVLDLVPHTLSVSRLDCESMSLTFGFDYTHRGNHNQLLADTLGLPTALDGICPGGNSQLLGYEPSIQFTLDEGCATQVRLNFESRTTGFHLRTGEFGEEQLSVYLTVRRFDSLGPEENFVDELHRLTNIGYQMLDRHIVDNVLRPLQQAVNKGAGGF